MQVRLAPFLCSLLVFSFSWSCGSDASDDDPSSANESSSTDSPSGSDQTAEKPTAVGEIADISQAGIEAFLLEQSYQSWPTRHQEPVTSTSAHRGIVKVYFNDTAAASLRAGKSTLAKGSVIVKEMFESDRTTVHGQAVMAKLHEGSGKASWIFFEGSLPEFSGAHYGAGISVCSSCHASGNDFVLSSLP